MAKLRMTDKHKAMAYILNEEFGYTMTRISDLMEVSQSTISSAIKEFKFQMQIKNYEYLLSESRKELESYKPKVKLLEFEDNDDFEDN